MPASAALTAEGRYGPASLVQNLDQGLGPLLLIGLAVFLIYRGGGTLRPLLGRLAPGFPSAALGIAAAVLISEAVSRLFWGRPAFFVPGLMGFLFSVALFLGAFLEEVRYRGYVQNQFFALFGARPWGKVAALLSAAGAYAVCRYPAVHQGPGGGGIPAFFKLVVLGAALGAAYEVSGSLWASALLSCWKSAYGIFTPVGSLFYALGPFVLFFLVWTIIKSARKSRCGTA
jgi:membrane protease YdiL (CAAX protease family)